jgi:hypothetical protein
VAAARGPLTTGTLVRRVPHFRDRKDEIVRRSATRQPIVLATVVSLAERVGVDEEWVLRNLRRNAVMAMRVGDRAAAARSLELIGKHLGMFIDRKSIDISYVDDADEHLAKLLELVGQPVLEHEPQQLEQLERSASCSPTPPSSPPTRIFYAGYGGPRCPRDKISRPAQGGSICLLGSLQLGAAAGRRRGALSQRDRRARPGDRRLFHSMISTGYKSTSRLNRGDD